MYDNNTNYLEIGKLSSRPQHVEPGSSASWLLFSGFRIFSCQQTGAEKFRNDSVHMLASTITLAALHQNGAAPSCVTSQKVETNTSNQLAVIEVVFFRQCEAMDG
jgi:hypothetical protein